MPTTTHDWFSCDGAGGSGPRPSRRAVLKTGAGLAAALAAWASGRSALGQVALHPQGQDAVRDVLVVLFLRGAADGLSVVVPYGDDDYYRARPTLALAAPAKGGTGDGKDGKTVRLDDFFALHPALAPLHPLYDDGLLAALHAVGSQDQTRSHFEAMAAMERGLANDAGRESSGWLARHLLSSAPTGAGSPLRAVSFEDVLPDSLRGSTDVSLVRSLADFKLDLPRPELSSALASLYAAGGADDAAAVAGRETLAVLDTLRRIDPAHYKPENGAKYPDSDLGRGLMQTACLVKAKVGLEVACLSRGGWDTHVAQGGATGFLALQLADVAQSVAAFAADLGKVGLARVTLVIQTEFGRRVRENSGLGTDHGRASAMLLLGGGVNGRRVYADWPGLADARLEPPGDLRVTTDYRAVLAEVVAKRLGNGAHLDRIFPGASVRPVGVVREG
jgi:uncharacterized protein (DUF1501 family)